MSFSFIKKLPTPEDIRNEYPVDSAIQTLKEKGTRKYGTYLPENPTNFLPLSVPAPQIMKMLYAIIFCACVRFRTKFQTKF